MAASGRLPAPTDGQKPSRISLIKDEYPGFTHNLESIGYTAGLDARKEFESFVERHGDRFSNLAFYEISESVSAVARETRTTATVLQVLNITDRMLGNRFDENETQSTIADLGNLARKLGRYPIDPAHLKAAASVFDDVFGVLRMAIRERERQPIPNIAREFLLRASNTDGDVQAIGELTQFYTKYFERKGMRT